MAYRLGLETAYKNVMAYAPASIQDYVRDEIPRVERSIEEAMDAFAVDLAGHIQKRVDEEVRSLEVELQPLRDELDAKVQKLREASEAGKGLGKATRSLKESLEQFETKYRNLGGKVRSTALSALRSAGIPLPG